MSTKTKEIRELLCQACNREYAVWFAPNEVWNQVVHSDEHFLCPTCFTSLAEIRGLRPTGWLVRPEKDEDGQLAQAKRLLIGSYHALKSYQFGNASSDLAAEVAEEIEQAGFGAKI